MFACFLFFLLAAGSKPAKPCHCIHHPTTPHTSPYLTPPLITPHHPTSHHIAYHLTSPTSPLHLLHSPAKSCRHPITITTPHPITTLASPSPSPHLPSPALPAHPPSPALPASPIASPYPPSSPLLHYSPHLAPLTPSTLMQRLATASHRLQPLSNPNPVPQQPLSNPTRPAQRNSSVPWTQKKSSPLCLYPSLPPLFSSCLLLVLPPRGSTYRSHYTAIAPSTSSASSDAAIAIALTPRLSCSTRPR